MTAWKKAATIALIFLLLCPGCGFLRGAERGGPADGPGTTVTVYRPGQVGDLLYPERYSIKREAGVSPAAAALGALIKEKPLEEGHANIFPPGTRLIALRIKDGLAEADFSKEILQGGVGGSLGEMLLVASIVNTLTEFPEISSVQLLVEGQKIDTVGGHTDVRDPLRRNESLIKKP
jgi:spore germination protein GerM